VSHCVTHGTTDTQNDRSLNLLQCSLRSHLAEIITIDTTALCISIALYDHTQAIIEQSHSASNDNIQRKNDQAEYSLDQHNIKHSGLQPVRFPHSRLVVPAIISLQAMKN